MLKSLGTELTAAILPLPLHEPSGRKNVLRKHLRTLIAGSRRLFLCVDRVCLLLELSEMHEV